MPELTAAMLGALALAFAFPKTGQTWLAPLGAAALFWAFSRLSWKRAFFTGWFAGTIFFAINFSWFSYTVGSFVGPFAFAVVLIPALVEALAFALSGLFASVAYRYAPPFVAPAAAAAAFAVFEWVRSIGVVAVPFAQIGYSQAGSAIGLFAAYIGSYGVTFVVMVTGAYLAHAVATRRPAALAAVLAFLATAWVGCYAAWPARHSLPATLRVAVVQGNIAQSLKWRKGMLERGVARYAGMTERLAAVHPQLVLWPETVITTDLNYTGPTEPSNPALREKFSRLARGLDTTLVLGSIDVHEGRQGLQEYNALFTYGPDGSLENIYDKRQLVPFVEALPARAWFEWLPDVNLISNFGHGTINTVLAAGGMRFAPLICWESAFADLVHAQIERGAQFLVIPTDDAWFGETSGPYQHAQIAQMRAIESGEWVVQAASTGISGIISPSGVWTRSTGLNREAVVVGSVGLPPGSPFARIGPRPVALALIGLYVAILGAGIGRRA